MKAKACSLYDKLKLHQLKFGYTMNAAELLGYVDLLGYREELGELARNGYIRLGEFDTIRILK